MAKVRIVEYGIYLAGKKIGTAWFDIWEYPRMVKDALVKDQGYDPAIKVRKLPGHIKDVDEWREDYN